MLPVKPVGDARLRGYVAVTEDRDLHVRTARRVRHGDRPEVDIGPRLGQFPEHRPVRGVRFEAEYRPRPADFAGKVIAEQAPARAGVHSDGAVPDKAVGKRCGEISALKLAAPHKFDCRLHGFISEVAADVAGRCEGRSRINQSAFCISKTKGHYLPSYVTCLLFLAPIWGPSLGPSRTP